MRMKEGRVYPTQRKAKTENSIELETVDHDVKQDRSSLLSPWDILSKQANAASKWLHYACRKREHKLGNNQHSRADKKDRDLSKGFLDSDCDEGTSDEDNQTVTSSQQRKATNRALLIYFAKLARADPDSHNTVVDFDFVESLLRNGADVNICDRYGQTILHEAARVWHPDVALFLIENGGDINKPDKYGRRPLHVAAAVDYPEMIMFLYEHGAEMDACTFGEHQTAVHYAAKNDADSALKTLIKIGVDVNCRDYKKRTPLQVAAELDRSATAEYLVRLGVPTGVRDENGLTALSLMVSKMPPVAKEALNQFHSLDRANRKQYYYLNYLEPRTPSEGEPSFARTPLQEAVRYKQMDLVMHPVFLRLIQVKWDYFGKTGSLVQVFIQLLYCLIWTILGVTLPRVTIAPLSYYDPPGKYWWRIVLETLAVSMTALFIWQEITEVRQSKRHHEQWKTWRIREMRRDLKYCHPRWPEESKYIKMEIDNISSRGLSYFRSYWNYFDWVTYVGILTVIVTRILSVAINNAQANTLHPKVMAIALIFIWLRLMKVFRAFKALGPFIVMIGHIIKDTLVFGFLYVEFFIPYVCAFWIIFGGDENAQKMKAAGQDTEGWRTFNNLMYSVWEITVVGNYSWESLLAVDRTMAQILCGSYLAVSSIVCLNLFIALMSDTFQRVYDNANANAIMQKATTILTLEEDLSAKRKEQFMMYIHSRCAPEEMYYDDDSVNADSGELERLTHQINDKVNELEEMLQETLQGKNEAAPIQKQLNSLRDDVIHMVEKQGREMNAMRQDIQDIKQLLQQAHGHFSSTPSLAGPRSPQATKGATSKSRKHHHRGNKSLPPVDSIHHTDIAPSTPAVLGLDIRREEPTNERVAFVAPSNSGAGQHTSSC